MRSRMSFPSVFVDFQAMFRRICKCASGTRQRAESPLDSLIWYRKRLISYLSSSLCRKGRGGGLLWWDRVKTKILCQRKNGTSLAVQWLRVWALIPGSPCHAVQWKEKKSVKKKRMRSYQWESYASVMGSLRYYFEVCSCYFFNENFTLLQKWFILQTTSLSSFCFSKAWVSSEFMRSGREKKAEAGWQRRENPQGWEGDGPADPKDYVDPWPTLRESSRISRRKCWTGHLGCRA